MYGAILMENIEKYFSKNLKKSIAVEKVLQSKKYCSRKSIAVEKVLQSKKYCNRKSYIV